MTAPRECEDGIAGSPLWDLDEIKIVKESAIPNKLEPSEEFRHAYEW
jgi:hypothetical protein